jgi:hypothetical protein
MKNRDGKIYSSEIDKWVDIEDISVCGFCGEETEKDFCSDNCWNGYKSETFDEK